jgi:hypothetical protein
VPRVVIIGARCRQQGVGEYVARWFAHAGAAVCAVVGTTAPTVAEARQTLAARYGIDCSGYVSVADALRVERPDIVAICSPYRLHRAHLHAAAEAGAHCLCEKPLWWDENPRTPESLERETARLVEAFAARGRYLATVTQWPLTLESFYMLYPELRHAPLERFDMRLSPGSRGKDMVPDAAPHAISMLARLAGPGVVAAPAVEAVTPDASDLRLSFSYRPAKKGSPTAAVSLRLSTCERPPRPAGYSINGRQVDRRIDLEGYNLYFENAERGIPLEDPLKLLVADFLKQVEAGSPVDRPGLVGAVTALAVLVRAAREHFEPGHKP